MRLMAGLRWAPVWLSESRSQSQSLSELATFRQNFGELYNNPVLMRYVNSVGQKIVPQGSPNVYSFRLLLDPVPRAEALTTGTIYISTGLVSMLDSEAERLSRMNGK